MAKGRKTKKGKGAGAPKGPVDPGRDGILSAEDRGDNRTALELSRAALADTEATPEAKEAALEARRRLMPDTVALAFAGGGAVLWLVILAIFVLSRG
jgi:hypothetical protein